MLKRADGRARCPGQSQERMTSDELFWLDPWSAQGQAASAKLLPVAPELRRHAEQAIVLLPGAPVQSPPEGGRCPRRHGPGARRLDLIGMKFQLAQEICWTYAQAVAQQHDEARHVETQNILDEISSMFGRCQDSAMHTPPQRENTARSGSARTGLIG